MERTEIILMKFFFRFERKYRLAMKKGRFIKLKVQNSKFKARDFENG